MEIVKCISEDCSYKGMCARGVDGDDKSNIVYDFWAVGCDVDSGYQNYIPTKEVCYKYGQ